MQRRQVLKLLGVNLLSNAFAQNAFAQSVTAPAIALSGSQWGYIGEGSPEHWGELSPEFQLCQIGRQQTPIDLAIDFSVGRVEVAAPEAIEIHYQPTPLRISNTARTILVAYAPGSSIAFRGETFQLLQFHFHHPSEHHVAGKPFDLELHLVHRSSAGKLAVIGVLVQAGAFNPRLQPLWDAMPTQPQTVEAKTVIDVTQLLPIDRRFYQYRGSLTTPPCSEDVLWFVMAQPIEMSAAQVEQFAAIFPSNARPLQSRGDRLIQLTPE